MLDISEIHNAKILIVDDQVANIVILKRMLQRDGYVNVDSVTDPLLVIDMHLQHRYDLFLLDLHMPGMDGFELMEHLTRIEADTYLPVLVITAQPEQKLRALDAGAKDFVSKPFDLVEMKIRIHNLLEVRLLYKKLEQYNHRLESAVEKRTEELRISENRFKSFVELSSDWYWEQDAFGKFTQVYGPVLEMLGIENIPASLSAEEQGPQLWNPMERAQLAENIAARKPFLDFIYTRRSAEGGTQYLQVSGEPMFDSNCRFIGYRGIGKFMGDPVLSVWPGP